MKDGLDCLEGSRLTVIWICKACPPDAIMKKSETKGEGETALKVFDEKQTSLKS